MTISEAHTVLVDRIKWRDDKTLKGFTLDAGNIALSTDKVYQSIHSAITLVNIREAQPLLDISDSDLNEYLTNLRSDCAQQVLADVFEKDYVNDNLFTLYPAAFDNCMMLRMVIIVSEAMMTTSRSNRKTRFSEEFVGKLHYDVFRDAPNKFAIRGANYNHALGASTRYRSELRSAQRRFGQDRNVLKTITKGPVSDPYKYINE